jgi:hypothetical protein
MYLSSLIKEAYENDSVIVAYIYGPMGYGKTSYALWTAYEVLGSWDRVLDYMFFDLKSAIDVMYKHIERGERLKIMIFDDAGFYLNRLTWWERDKILFMELLNLARTISAGVLFTSPSHEIPRQILAKTNYRINVRPLQTDEMNSESVSHVLKVAKKYNVEGGGVAVARGYQLVVLPSFFKIVKKDFIDYYPLWYPVYEEYQRIRIMHIRKKLKELKEVLNESREEILEEAKNIYIKTKSSEAVYNFLKHKLPRSTAYKWAFYKIPKIVEVIKEEETTMSHTHKE